MKQLIYASAATAPFSREDLRQLLSKARTNNHRLGLTGMLVYDEGSFLQVLEGPDDAVDHIYERISRDRRHDKILLLASSKVNARSFSEWQMGFVDSRDTDLTGFSNFFHRKMPFAGSEVDKAREILIRFKNGRWRRHVTT